MHNRFSLYPRLALTNLRKNRKFYLPYLLTGIVTVMMSYIMTTLARDPALDTMRGGMDVRFVLVLGSVVIGIFAAIILFYTSSVLTKQRKKEFGLYNILGMEKRHIGRVLVFETFDTVLLTLGVGILFGVVFSKLMQLLLLRILGSDVKFGLRFDPIALLITAILFLSIYFIIFLNTLRVIHLSSPVELLHGSQTGEKEPKSRWILAILGVLFLGGGYAIAITTNDAVSAILYFFVAVLMVIAGTYLLFTAFSIVFLKGLKKNKRYYYQTKHFPTVSGMLYRMKRNAAGLASICILSTMVLVTISTTVSLYIGVDSVIDGRYPYDLTVTDVNPTAMEDPAETERIILDSASDWGLEVKDLASYYYLQFAAIREGNDLIVKESIDNRYNAVNIWMVWLTDADGYRAMTGKDAGLADGEVLYISDGEPFGDTLDLMGATYRMHRLDETFRTGNSMYNLGYGTVSLVVSDFETLEAICHAQAQIYRSAINHVTRCNLTGTNQEKLNCGNDVVEKTQTVHRSDGDDYYYNRTKCKQQARNDYFSSFGAFFFLGMFLGLLFLLATVLIIYYKQVSEGYDDRERFSIMQKVGMTKSEVRAAIRSQVLTVFFLPLVTAAIHITFAFPMIRYILMAFGLTDTGLFLICTLISFAVFAVVYVIVYLLTARAYYRIVDDPEHE